MLLIALFSTQLLSATPIVVLDPGHGGEYDGAVGVCGLKEKDVVMTVAKETRELLNQMGTVDARLTRSGDHHLPLESRTQMANDLGASLFVSIHANSSPSSRSKGIETFVLSRRAADRYAQEILERENSEGSTLVEVKKEPLDLILDQLEHAANQRTSQQFAHLTQDTLPEALGVRNRGVLQAPFRVLRGAKMPAILVEIGFLTHQDECPKLAQEDYQRQIARALAGSIANMQTQLNLRATGSSARPKSSKAP